MVRIITDSASDLDVEVAQKKGFHILPLKVIIGGESYRDRIDLSNAEFYQRIQQESKLPTTSQVAPNEFQECFEKILATGEQVLCICFSSHLSGTCQSACLAKEMLGSPDIEVIDTKCASVGQGLVVLEAVEMAAKGASLAEIKEKVLDMAASMEHIFVVGSLEMLKRGGRISATQAVLGNLLNIKPILQFDEGKIVPYDKARGWKKAIHTLVETMAARGVNLAEQKIGISHSANLEMVEELKKAIAEQFDIKDIFVSEIGPVIGSHVGAGTLALFFKNR